MLITGLKSTFEYGEGGNSSIFRNCCAYAPVLLSTANADEP